MGTLTVRENLAFSASLRLSSEYSDSDRKARVEQIIQDLGLSRCADTRVSCVMLTFSYGTNQPFRQDVVKLHMKDTRETSNVFIDS